MYEAPEVKQKWSWPIPLESVRRMTESQLAPFMEKPPRWQQLREASPKALNSYARGFLQRLATEHDETEAPMTVLLQDLGLPQKESGSPINAGNLVLSEEGISDFVRAACSSGHACGRWRRGREGAADCPPRLLEQWPARSAARTAVALLVAARLCEGGGATPETPLSNEDVDTAIASFFRQPPDTQVIRKHMAELVFVRVEHKDDSEGRSSLFLNFEQLQKASDGLLNLAS
eukprot:gnl/TRDRNA2_/TRDRNA2_206951_c0_seq1.p1 gnl/TRDRNA2_/TRDRNA2_206951_c0~~gnl/TRDRNA2_/TRDRNA2_206951_c0_seq1.p1  ORF type:complete len:255 (-),score=39.57 gnl/TRDRNA2_/TRDRNA2_206951_c0_seq1:121-816(-)